MVAQNQRVFPRGNPFCMIKVTRRCVPGSRVGSFMLSQDANDRCLSHGLRSDLRGMLKSMSVEGPSSLMANQFSQAQVDLFASRETSHYPLWFSLTHPAPLGLGAMVQTWPRLRLYAFP